MSTPATKAASLWSDPDAHPIALDALLIGRYGAAWLEWEPETLIALVEKDFGAQMTDLHLGKVQACKALHLVDSYWLQWEVFGWCTMAFAGSAVDFELLQVPTVAQVLVSLDAAERIRSDVAFSDEVKIFIAEVHRHDGIALAVPPASGLVDLSPGDFGLSPEQGDTLRSAWAERKADAADPQVRKQLERLHVVTTYLEESRTRLHEQLRQVSDAR